MPELRLPIVSTAILCVDDMTTATDFYRRLGFTVDLFDDDYAIVGSADAEMLHLQKRNCDSRGSVYLNVPDVDDWHRRCDSAGAPVTIVEDQIWGMREFTATDPSGNRLRIGTNR